MPLSEQTTQERPSIFRMAGDRRGVVAMEFAIIGPIVLLALASAWSLLALHMGNTALEGAVAAASRRAIIGPDSVSGGTREEMIRRVITEHVCPASLGQGTTCYWEDDGATPPLAIDMRAYVDPQNIGQPESFSDTNGDGLHNAGEAFVDTNENGQWDSDMGRASAGGAGDHVVYTVTMQQAIANPVLITLLGRTYAHEAVVVVRNEPWELP